MTDTSKQADPGARFLAEASLPENMANPYDLYGRLRNESPILDTGLNVWFTFTHDAAHQLLRAKHASSDRRNSTSFKRELPNSPELQEYASRNLSMLFLDPPEHTRLRKLVSAAFTPRTVELLNPRIEALTASMLDSIAEAETVDLIETLAYPLPVAVICELLGVPREDEAIFGQWSTTLTKGLDPEMLISAEDAIAIEQARVELDAYTGDLLTRRRKNPGDDLLSGLLAARDGQDRLSEAEMVSMVLLLLIAGHETTVNLIGNGVVALLRNPDQLSRWRNEPDLGKNAVDELLRYDTPVQVSGRSLLEPMTVHEVDIPAGDEVVTLLGAANRDPALFDDPDTLDLGRANANRHMSFGGGIHHCLGAALARIEGLIAIGRLIERFPSIELVEEPQVGARFVLRGFDEVRIAVSQ